MEMILRLDRMFLNEMYAKVLEGVDSTNVKSYIPFLKEVELKAKKSARQNTL